MPIIPNTLKVALSCVLCAALISCAPKGPEYAESEREYSLQSVSDVFGSADASDIEDVKTSDAPRRRHNSLAALRGQGDGASSAADLITRSFPANTRGVPVYVERARMDGADVLLVVEAFGPRDGVLSDMRLWVLSSGGEVVYSAVR